MKYNRILHIITISVAIITILSVTSVHLYAQTRKVMNRPYIDQRRFHYGFLAGIQMQDLEIEQNGYTDGNGNQWSVEIPNYEPGFTVGILGEMYLTKNLALRVIPTMHFGTKNLKFRNSLNKDTRFLNLKSTYFSVPVDIKISGERFNNYRPYLMAGINPVIDLTVKKQKELLLNNFDCFLEVGMGCDFYAPWFKFIPEVKFCYGLNNIINKNRKDMTDQNQMIFTESVNKGRSKMIVLTFYFE